MGSCFLYKHKNDFGHVWSNILPIAATEKIKPYVEGINHSFEGCMSPKPKDFAFCRRHLPRLWPELSFFDRRTLIQVYILSNWLTGAEVAPDNLLLKCYSKWFGVFIYITHWIFMYILRDWISAWLIPITAWYICLVLKILLKKNHTHTQFTHISMKIWRYEDLTLFLNVHYVAYYSLYLTEHIWTWVVPVDCNSSDTTLVKHWLFWNSRGRHIDRK